MAKSKVDAYNLILVDLLGTRLYLGNSPEQSKLGIGFSLPWFYYKNIKENETKRLDLLCSIS